MGQSVRVLVGPRPPPGYVSRLFTRGAGVEAFLILAAARSKLARVNCSTPAVAAGIMGGGWFELQPGQPPAKPSGYSKRAHAFYFSRFRCSSLRLQTARTGRRPWPAVSSGVQVNTVPAGFFFSFHFFLRFFFWSPSPTCPPTWCFMRPITAGWFSAP